MLAQYIVRNSTRTAIIKCFGSSVAETIWPRDLLKASNLSPFPYLVLQCAV
jgi:hypothetical protein